MSGRNPFEVSDDEHDLQMAKTKIEDSMLESTRRALGLLAESEDVGVRSAAELVEQGQALERIDQKLSQANQTLSETQRNINSLKSTFGGFGSRLFSKVGRQKASQGMSGSQSKLEKYLQTDAKGGAQQLISSTNKASSSQTVAQQSSQSMISPREQEVESNLGEMSQYLTRLKGLAENMNDELQRQNVFITEIKDSSEKVDVKMTAQRDALQKILRK